MVVQTLNVPLMQVEENVTSKSVNFFLGFVAKTAAAPNKRAPAGIIALEIFIKSVYIVLI